VGLVGNGNCATAEVIGGVSGQAVTAPLWKICTSDRLHVGRFGKNPRVAAVDFERDRVAVEDGPVFIYDGSTDQRTTLADSGAYESLCSTSFSPGGRYLFAVAQPKSLVPERVAVWEVESGRLLHRLRVNDEFAGFPAVSRDEQHLAAAWGKQAHLFDLATGREIKTAPLPSFTQWLRLDPGSNEFVLRTRIGRTRLDASLSVVQRWAGWRMQPIEDGASLAFFLSGERRLATLELTQDGHVVYTPEGRYAASGSPPDHLHRFEPSSGRVTRLTRMPGMNDVVAVRNAFRQPPAAPRAVHPHPSVLHLTRGSR
jgi:WD40 repeat protein